MTKFTRYKAAAVQYEPKIHGKAENTKHQLRMAAEAGKGGAKLIVLPEMNQVGYCYYGRDEVRPYVEPIPGPTTDLYAEVARRYETHIVVGLAEVNPETNNYYNAQALIGPDGLIGKYRKVHSYISEPKWAKDGDLGFPVYDTDIGRLGMLICMDQHFFESSRILSRKGADVICFSTAWLDERGPAPVWITRAFENGVYVVCADRWGLERGTQFTGSSCILNPDGTIQSMKDAGNAIVYGEIDLDLARDKKFPNGDGDRLMDRRPEEYMQVSLNTYLWNPLNFFGLYRKKPLPPGRKSVITVAQFHQKRMAQDENTAKMTHMAESAAKAKSKLVVFPELSTSGAVFRSAEDADGVAETSKGDTIRRLISIAKKTKTHLITSFVEREGANLYNTAVLLSEKGLVGKYRKLHLNHLDRRWATPGNIGLPTFDTPSGRIGMLIGHDSVFPETFRCLASEGTDIIAVPSAVEYPSPIASRGTSIPHPKPIPTGADQLHWHLWRVRAGENCTYVAFANQIGAESGASFMGRSGIFQPDLFAFPRKETVASANKEEIRSLVIDTTNLNSDLPTNPVRAKYLLKMRQPFWYDPVLTSGRIEPSKVEILPQAKTTVRHN
ncbi:MAG TPA: nitrilase-related carbon-nitrogen hydrolase [Nitrososphaerales archaeon]|nr:nitrilase-related carbon-nitrogen hydrolase [Nitrososphaerales archaeon]